MDLPCVPVGTGSPCRGAPTRPEPFPSPSSSVTGRVGDQGLKLTLLTRFLGTFVKDGSSDVAPAPRPQLQPLHLPVSHFPAAAQETDLLSEEKVNGTPATSENTQVSTPGP